MSFKVGDKIDANGLWSHFGVPPYEVYEVRESDGFLRITPDDAPNTYYVNPAVARPASVPVGQKPPPLTPLMFTAEDHEKAGKIADALGYTQTAFTSTSALWGLYCLPHRLSQKRGVIIKTRELGLLFVMSEDAILGT